MYVRISIGKSKLAFCVCAGRKDMLAEVRFSVTTFEAVRECQDSLPVCVLYIVLLLVYPYLLRSG